MFQVLPPLSNENLILQVFQVVDLAYALPQKAMKGLFYLPM